MFTEPKLQRKKKLEQLIHQEIAQVLRSLLQFERTSIAKSRLTVMKTRSSPDMRKVDVFLSADSPEAFNLIRQRASKIRHTLAGKLDLRRTPELHFLPWTDSMLSLE